MSLNFAAMRSVLEGESGDGVTQRVERWALHRLSGMLQIETLWRFNAKYEPTWLPRYIVFDSAEQFVPVVVQIMRAESLTEVPVIGRLLTTGAAKRAGPAVPEEVLAVLNESGERTGGRAGGRAGGPAVRPLVPASAGRAKTGRPVPTPARAAAIPSRTGRATTVTAAGRNSRRRERPPHHS